MTTELADISLGEAWLQPYSQQRQGTSIVITRSPLAERLIQEDIKSQQTTMEQILSDTMRASQQESYNRRHEDLYVRVREVKLKD